MSRYMINKITTDLNQSLSSELQAQRILALHDWNVDLGYEYLEAGSSKQSIREPLASTRREVRLLASKPYLLSLSQRQRLRFKLLANPIKTIRDEAGRLNANGEIKKSRVPLIRDEELRAWLMKKLDGKAVVETVETEKEMTLNFYKSGERRVGKIQPVFFQGILEILSIEGLKGLIERGIGPGKAFGCGMLSLARC